MTLKLISPPTEEPVTLADLKLQCRIDGTDEDALLATFISAARRKAEGELRRVLITSTWEQAFDDFPEAEVRLDGCPLQSVTSITYLDAQGVERAVDQSLYLVDTFQEPSFVIPASPWPATAASVNAVRVRLVAGYGAAADVPADIRAWILLTAAYLYEQREAMDLTGRTTALPGNWLGGLLDPYRVYNL